MQPTAPGTTMRHSSRTSSYERPPLCERAERTRKRVRAKSTLRTAAASSAAGVLPPAKKARRTGRKSVREASRKSTLRTNKEKIPVNVGGVEQDTVLSTYTSNAVAIVHKDYSDLRPGIETRLVAVDWMAEACVHLRMRETTWALAVTLLDRYCQSTHVRARKLQAAAVAALFIASKHEERVPVRISKLINVSAGAARSKDVLTLESAILNSVNWKVAVPHALSVVRAVAPKDAMPVARYAAAVSMLDARLASVPPPLVTAAAVQIACVVVDQLESAPKNPWPEYAVHGIARRILRVWCHLVASHDAGNAVFVVRERAFEAARIFPLDAFHRLAQAFGEDAVQCARGKFVRWAAAQSP